MKSTASNNKAKKLALVVVGLVLLCPKNAHFAPRNAQLTQRDGDFVFPNVTDDHAENYPPTHFAPNATPQYEDDGKRSIDTFANNQTKLDDWERNHNQTKIASDVLQIEWRMPVTTRINRNYSTEQKSYNYPNKCDCFHADENEVEEPRCQREQVSMSCDKVYINSTNSPVMWLQQAFDKNLSDSRKFHEFLRRDNCSYQSSSDYIVKNVTRDGKIVLHQDSRLPRNAHVISVCINNSAFKLQSTHANMRACHELLRNMILLIEWCTVSNCIQHERKLIATPENYFSDV